MPVLKLLSVTKTEKLGVDRQELILLFLRIFEKLLLAFMNRDFYFRIVAIYLRFKYNESHVVLFSGQWSSQC